MFYWIKFWWVGVINTLLLLPLPRSFLPPLLPYVLSDYPLLLPLMTTISVPVLLAQTSRIPLRLSIFPLFSSRLLSSGLLPQPLLPYFLYKMALYRRLFLPSYFWLYPSLSLAIHPFHPKTRDFRGRHPWFFPNILSAAFLYFLYRLGCCVWFFFTVSFCLCRNLHIALSLNLTPVLSCQYSQYSEARVIWMFCYHLFEMFFLTKELARFPPFCLTRE